MVRNKFLKEGSLYELDYEFEDMANFIGECSRIYKTGKHKSLGVLLGLLRGLEMVHTAHHWQTSGEDYYGDHLLFERLASKISDEIDTVAEKIVGVDELELTNYFAQLQNAKAFLDLLGGKGDSLAKESFRFELTFVVAAETVMGILEKDGLLTRGLEQALGDILDAHEKNIYLLKQRTR